MVRPFFVLGSIKIIGLVVVRDLLQTREKLVLNIAV